MVVDFANIQNNKWHTIYIACYVLEHYLQSRSTKL